MNNKRIIICNLYQHIEMIQLKQKKNKFIERERIIISNPYQYIEMIHWKQTKLRVIERITICKQYQYNKMIQAYINYIKHNEMIHTKE